MANNILEMALEQLDFPPSTISAWFDDVTVVSFGDNRLVLHSPVPFKKEFIDRYDASEVLKDNHLTPEQIAEDIAATL